MKRAIMLASGAALAMALATPSLAEDLGELIYVDVTESAYISEKAVRIVAKQKAGKPDEKAKTKNVEPQKTTTLTTATYETGTRVWRQPSGLCYMEKRTLDGIEEFSGVQFPQIRVKSGSADCETREFMDASDFPS